MDVTSLLFIVFAILSSFLFYILPHKLRWVALTLSSVVFLILLDIKLLFMLVPYVIINYIFAKLLQNNFKTNTKKIILIIPIIFDLLILGFYKYFFFLINNIQVLFPALHYTQVFDINDIVIPIGISFFSFKIISLLIDSYRSQIENLSFKNAFLYIIFFPEFLSGPISRYSYFCNQINIKPNFNIQNYFDGGYRIIVGIFKKLVISNTIAQLINPIFSNYQNYRSIELLIASILFSVQIYADFSGYVDIMLGVGKIFGLILPENFNHPYFASSIRDFWRRWHISLSSWFKDYIYIPLGGNRKGETKQYVNILIVFLITGLWHGSNWNFVFWGLIHGLYQVISALTVKYIKTPFLNPKLKYRMGIIFTFSFVNFAWIYFRSESINQANNIIKQIFSFNPGFNLNMDTLVMPFVLTIIFYGLVLFKTNLRTTNNIKVALSVITLIFGIFFFSSSQAQDFLYFKF